MSNNSNVRNDYNYGSGLDFDIDRYRKKNILPKPTPKKDDLNNVEDKDDKKETKVSKEEHSSKEKNSSALVSRLVAMLLSSLIMSIISVALFTLFGGPKLFAANFKAMENKSAMYETLLENANNGPSVKSSDGQILSWDEYVESLNYANR